MNQVPLPLQNIVVPPEGVARKKTLGQAIDLCAELAGFSLDKQLSDALKVDKGQFSRWQSGQEGIKWDKFCSLMDVCANDAPLMWMLHQRGYDLYSLRQRETETQKENRLLREEVTALRRVLSRGA